MDDPPPLQHTRVLTPHLARSLQPGLELLDERRFSNGVVYLRYRPL